jgi:hypothetical protein
VSFFKSRKGPTLSEWWSQKHTFLLRKKNILIILIIMRQGRVGRRSHRKRNKEPKRKVGIGT